MKKNMGSLDRTVRILAALVIALLYVFNVISGTLAIVLGIVAVVFLLTSFAGFCPLYVLLNINT
ncbi:MAG: YgaP family membrane protein, partial [Candidatus Oleimicrobiaceae bacterium]